MAAMRRRTARFLAATDTERNEMHGMDAGIANSTASTSPEERLELGEVVSFPTCPFSLPAPGDCEILRRQQLHASKEIAYIERVTGFAPHSPAEEERVERILADASHEATRWIAEFLPDYRGGLTLLKTCFHPEEEATRTLRASARNDLLHVDALRPTHGSRILRLGVNLHPTDLRVWATSETLARVLPQEAPLSGLLAPPPLAWPVRTGRQFVRLFRPTHIERSPYDDFMLAFSRHLKLSDIFQDRSPRKLCRFLPGATWLAMTDGLVHAELRGRFVLEHVFLVSPSRWRRPDIAPRTLVEDLGVSLQAAA
jgi:hypothetical protein